jgi:hypothetical protein
MAHAVVETHGRVAQMGDTGLDIEQITGPGLVVKGQLKLKGGQGFLIKKPFEISI